MNTLDILPKDIDSDIFIGNALGAFGRALSDKIDESWMETTGRTTAACYAISQIGSEPGSTIKILASMLGIEHSSLVRLLDRLEKDDVIKRKDNKIDKREKNIFLTKKGEDILTQMIDARRTVLKPVVNSLDEQEILTLYNLIQKMTPTVVRGGDDQHYVCRLCELEICPQEICPVNLADENYYEVPKKSFRRKVCSKRLVAAE